MSRCFQHGQAEKAYFEGKELVVLNGVYAPKEDSFLLARSAKFRKHATVLDLGAGCGIQGINALMQGAKLVVFADVNGIALRNCELNCERLGFESFRLVKSDLFGSVTGKFDAVVFNAPYAASDRIKWIEVDGGRKGREVLDSFLEQLPMHLNAGGECFFLQSSLNGEKETGKSLENKGFEWEIAARQRLFFEELVVFKAWGK